MSNRLKLAACLTAAVLAAAATRAAYKPHSLPTVTIPTAAADDASKAAQASKTDTSTAASEDALNPAAVVSSDPCGDLLAQVESLQFQLATLKQRADEYRQSNEALQKQLRPTSQPGKSPVDFRQVAVVSLPHDVSTSISADSQPTIAEQMRDRCYEVTGISRPLDPSLCQAAQQYADYLAASHQENHFADHDPEHRAKRAGFTGSLRQPSKRLANGEISQGIGEVLAFGHATLEQAFQYEIVDANGRVYRGGWMYSPGHRSALLEPTFDVCGFAKARDANIYVGLFGNSKVAAAAPQVSQPVRSAPQVFSSCGPNGCGQQYQRRGFFGRR